MRTAWHQKKVDFLDLQRLELTCLHKSTIKSEYSTDHSLREGHTQRTTIAKIARFPWEVRYIEAKTIYQALQSSRIGPRLGHLHEGRVIGHVHKVELLGLAGQGPRSASRHADLDIYRRALRLRRLGILHGDINRHKSSLILATRLCLLI